MLLKCIEKGDDNKWFFFHLTCFGYIKSLKNYSFGTTIKLRKVLKHIMNYCIREKKLYFLWTLTVFGIIGQKYFTDSVLVSLRIAQCPMLKMVLFIQESLIKIDCFYLYLSIIPHKNKTNSVCNLCTAVQHPSEYCNHVQYRNIRVEDPDTFEFFQSEY